ncbi:MAG: DNA mismatch repair endonuclease MutL [Promethearchaeota archaeon]
MKIKLIQGYEKIAAGEVIERPASVVKELVENSMDAGATQIYVTITNAGKDLIQITDNGCGIDESEMEFAFHSHTSSKIDSADQLDSITTLGFRGEALASVAAVSQIEMTSRPAAQNHGTLLQLVPGTLPEKNPCGAPLGTTIKIKNLFYNFPVRKKFLRSNRIELGHITDLITRYSLAYPLIHFKLEHNGLMLINSPQWRGTIDKSAPNIIDVGQLNETLLEAYGFAIQNIYGKKIMKQLIPVQFVEHDFSFFGYIGHPEIARSEKKASSLFVNHRLITNAEIFQIVSEAYKDYLMRHKYPFFILFLQVSPNTVDFNVHPTKKIVKFVDEAKFFVELQLSLSKIVGKELQSAFRRNNQSIPDGKPYQKTALDYWTPQSKSQLQTYSLPKDQTLGAQQSQDLKGIPPISVDDLLQTATNTTSSSSSPSSTFSPSSSPSSPKPTRPHTPTHSSSRNQNQTVSGKNPSSLRKPTSPQRTLPGVKSPTLSESSRLNSSSPVQTHFAFGKQKTESQDLVTSPFLPVKNLPPLFLLNNGIQAGDKYLIFQNEGNLIIIDQHAAHERINYERVQKWERQEKLPIQKLIMPIKMDVPPHEVDFITAAINDLKIYGFEVEHFGANTFVLRSIPAILKSDVQSQQLVIDLCLEIIAMGKERSLSEMKREILQYMGCHKSIRAGDTIWDQATLKKLIRDLDGCENPHHCAHGRPTYIKIPFEDLDKWFHRT